MEILENKVQNAALQPADAGTGLLPACQIKKTKQQ